MKPIKLKPTKMKPTTTHVQVVAMATGYQGDTPAQGGNGDDPMQDIHITLNKDMHHAQMVQGP